LAALEALQHVAKVGILDLDAHAGGGTFDILQDHPQVYLADVTVSPFDDWKPKYPERHFYQTVDDPEDYLPQVALALKHLEGIKFLIYNAGMDTHEKAGGLRGINTHLIQQREELVVAWARQRQIPHIFALAGGYTWSGLTIQEVAQLHLETIKAFSR
jgi:acetoin utilization deacetylase AcuC-like enzyme